jgi:predicted O-linked N-acetylglucosamine transferase (SPINDLY family)
VGRLTNRELAGLIEELAIDLLVDLNGFSNPDRLRLFALRPAPVQVAWFNHFATSGMSCFDYLLGDRHVFRLEEAEFYAENVEQLSGSYLTFQVSYPVPDVVPAPCQRLGHLTFGCFAPQYKITTSVIEAWSRILRACPETRMVLKNKSLGKPAAREFVHGQFARFSIPAERVVLEGPAEHYAFLERYAEIDIALDTFPYNGGTTTMEAIWQGVPVMAFTGDRWAARISTSILREAGLAEFVAPDLEGYVARAIALARAPEAPARLDSLRRTLRDRLRTCSVCDVRTFARNIEDAYLDIWRRYRQGSEQ